MDIVKEMADKYQDFFDFMYQEHNLILTIDEMNEIVYEAEKLKKKFDENDSSEIKKTEMKRVILESPYAGDVERNIKYARECLKDSLRRGEAPIASHLLYTQKDVLDDNIPEERQLGIDAGLAWKKVADLHVFYIDFGMSSGMKYARNYAKEQNIDVEYRTIYAKKQNKNMNNKIKLQEGYSFCEACEGTGATPMYMDCRDSSNNCCGGCDWVYEECTECDGYGQIEIDEDEYV